MKTLEELTEDIFSDTKGIDLYTLAKTSIGTAIKQCANIAENTFNGTSEKISGDIISEEILKQLEQQNNNNPELDSCITELNKKQWLNRPYPLPELIKALITISERLNKLEELK